MNTPSTRLGVGVDYLNAHEYPFDGGADGLLRRLRTRLSHAQLITLADAAEITHVREVLDGVPSVQHLVGVDPVRHEGPNLERFDKQNEHSRLLDAAWHYEDLGYWYIGPYNAPAFMPPLLERDVAEHTARNIRELNRRSEVLFMPENPSCTFTAGTLSLGEFFTRVVDLADCPMVLDLSHLYSYALLWQQDPFEVLQTFPVERVWELHVAGGVVDPSEPRRYLDNHIDEVRPIVLRLLEAAVESMPQLRAITSETSADASPEVLLQDFDRIERVLDDCDFQPRVAV